MGLCDETSRIQRTLQVTGYDGIERTVLKILTYLTSLEDAVLSKFPLRLSLHNLIDIIYRFAVSD
jgi:hypothetical protein